MRSWVSHMAKGKASPQTSTLSSMACHQKVGERVHNACRELSKHGEWTIADLLLYLGRLDNAVQEEGTGVTCTTIHSAKGREFCNVFIVGCEEGNLPKHPKGHRD